MNVNKLNKPYIIAEIGCNHNGDVELGLKMIKAAKDCGADAVKFQFFTEKNLSTNDYLDELDSGIVKLENVESWSTKELGLNSVREQINAFSNDENELIISDTTSSDEIEDWDSLNHINLVSAIEKEFKIKFALQEFMILKDVGSMVNLIVEKLTP